MKLNLSLWFWTVKLGGFVMALYMDQKSKLSATVSDIYIYIYIWDKNYIISSGQ